MIVNGKTNSHPEEGRPEIRNARNYTLVRQYKSISNCEIWAQECEMCPSFHHFIGLAGYSSLGVGGCRWPALGKPAFVLWTSCCVILLFPSTTPPAIRRAALG
jgi:hypothetical protein